MMTSLPVSKFDYTAAQYEEVVCNYCGFSGHCVISRKDRYGLNTRTVVCRRCGLIFINPRMTKEWYGRFYAGAYREQTMIYKDRKKKPDPEKGFWHAKKLGISLASQIKSHLKDGLLVEVGSSRGGVLAGFKEVMPSLEILGIEPSPDESDFARRKGIRTHQALFEDLSFEVSGADNIMIVRSLNHLLDPKRFFDWAWRELKEDGRLVIMVVNFTRACQNRGRLATQIDHPFMFSRRTLENFVKSAGFRILFADLRTRPDYIQMVAVKSERGEAAQSKTDPVIYYQTLISLHPFVLKLRYLFGLLKRKVFPVS